MARLLWLPDVLRAAGLIVHEVSGWRTRGSDTYDPRGVICHATAGSSTSTDAGEIRVLLEGSTSAPPPIAQLYLSRTGAWHVVASGRCNHAKVGWGGPLEGLGNTNLIGVEAQNDNRGQRWPAVQVDAYERGVAAICRRMGWTASKVAAHREHQPGAKSDPHGIDMGQFRARVSALLAGEDDEVTEEQLIAAVQKALTTAMPLPGRVGDRMVAAGWAPGMSPWEVLARTVESIVLPRDLVDEQQVADELVGPLTAALSPLLAVLTPAAIAAAIPAELAEQVADELAARLGE